MKKSLKELPFGITNSEGGQHQHFAGQYQQIIQFRLKAYVFNFVILCFAKCSQLIHNWKVRKSAA